MDRQQEERQRGREEGQSSDCLFVYLFIKCIAILVPMAIFRPRRAEVD